MFVALGSRSLKDVFDVACDVRDCFFAVFDLEEGEDDYNDFDDEDENAYEDGKVTKTGFFIVVATPGCSPVDDPNQIYQ